MTVVSGIDLLVGPGEVVAGGVAGGTDGAVGVEVAPCAAVRARFSAPTHRGRLRQGDGSAIDVVLGTAGDILLEHTGGATFLVDPAARTVLCGPDRVAAAGWRRVLLDTVLATAALALGGEALHAGAVEVAGRVVAVAAGEGGGKSTVCAELVRRGGRLVTDDVLFVDAGRGGTAVHPGPPVMSLPSAWPGRPEELGRVLAVLAGESWVAVDRAASGPSPLGALVVLHRRPGIGGWTVERAVPAAELLALALDSGPDPARRRARFETVSAVAAGTAVRLVAGLDVAPGVLADAVEAVACGAVPG